MTLAKLLIVAGLNAALLGGAPCLAGPDVQDPQPAVQSAETMAQSIDSAVTRALTMMTAILETSPAELGASHSLSLFSEGEPFPVYGLEDAPLKLSREQRALLAREQRLYFYVSGTKPSIMLVVRDDAGRTAMIQFPITALARLIALQSEPGVQALLTVKGQLIGTSSLTVDEQVAASSLTGARPKAVVVDGIPLAYAPTEIMGVGVLVRKGEAPPAPEVRPTASRWLSGSLGSHRLPPLLALGLVGGVVGTLWVRRRRRGARAVGASPALDVVAWVQLSTQAERSFAELKRPLGHALARVDALIDGAGLRTLKSLEDAVALSEGLSLQARRLRDAMHRLKAEHSTPRLAILKAALDVALVAIQADEPDPWLQHTATRLRELADPLEDFLMLDERLHHLQLAFEELAREVETLAQDARRLHRAEQLLESSSAQASQLIQVARHLRLSLGKRFARLGTSLEAGDLRPLLGAARQQLGLELAKVQRLTNESRNNVSEVAVTLDGCQRVMSVGGGAVSGLCERTTAFSEQLLALHAMIRAWDAEPVGEVLIALNRAIRLLESERGLKTDEGLQEGLASLTHLLRSVLELRAESERELQRLVADCRRLVRLLSANLRKSSEPLPPCEDVYAELGACKTHLQAARTALNQLQMSLDQASLQPA